MSSLQCRGTESSLLECHQNACDIINCTHDYDVGVVCQKPAVPSSSTNSHSSSTHSSTPSLASPSSSSTSSSTSSSLSSILPSPSPVTSSVSSPSVTPTPTLPANSGVIVVLSRTNNRNFDASSFKGITAEALNDYCSINDCNAIPQKGKKASKNVIGANNVIIIQTVESDFGLSVIFYVTSSSGAPIDPSAVLEAVKEADSKYAIAGFKIAAFTLVDPPNSMTSTVSITPIDGRRSAGQISGIVIGAIIGTLLIVISIIIVIIVMWRYLCKGYNLCPSLKGGISGNDSDLLVQNIYDASSHVNPEGSIHSLKSKSSDSREVSDYGYENENQSKSSCSQLKNEVLEVSKETNL